MERPRAYRLGMALASPTGIVLIVPALVVLVGVGVLLLGLAATRETSERMAKQQLRAQAADAAHHIASALEQATPILERLRPLADRTLPFEAVAQRLHDLHVGRVGVKSVAVRFADGMARATYVDGGGVRVHETTLPPAGATARSARVGDVELVVDFDPAALGQLVARAPMRDARTVVYARDGRVLVGDVHASAIALLGVPERQRFVRVGDELASVAPLPLDLVLATFVHERPLLEPRDRLQRRSLLAAAGALVLAVVMALVFAWNLVRMRKLVGAERERARSAEERATELGSYRLVEKLGAGGMGEVWRGEHRLLARQAAIKLVRADTLKDPVRALKLRERFRREAQTLASMRSRHTIALYDYGVADDGTFFYVMELLEGLDLDRYVRMYGAMPAARVIDLLAQACQSLAEAHDAGLLHRDIKPANLFLTRAADEVDILKLLDFGIVGHVGERDADPLDAVALPTIEERLRTQRLTKNGAVIGTSGYIAPEQASGGTIDGRSDLYALGCVAWWLLAAGEIYPRPTDEDELLRAHREEPLPDLLARVHGWLPPELAALVADLLAKRAGDRPANARAVAERLRAIAIPEEHAWTQARALAWWERHEARRSAEVAPAGEKRLLVSDRTSRP